MTRREETRGGTKLQGELPNSPKDDRIIPIVASLLFSFRSALGVTLSERAKPECCISGVVAPKNQHLNRGASKMQNVVVVGLASAIRQPTRCHALASGSMQTSNRGIAK